MQLNELRKTLVSTGLAYKSERMRTLEFQNKLDGALRQLNRKEAIDEQLLKIKE